MKRFIAFTLLFLAVCAVARPHTRGRVLVYSQEQEKTRKKVGLVLSGGGAKGVAHVGVIRVLEEAGIPIDYIAGTSMGAIVGGLYAIGYTVDELDSLVRKQDWPALLRDRVPRSERILSERESTDRYVVSIPLSRDRRIRIPSGFLAGQNVHNLLCELTVGYHDSIPFRSLPIPFTCIAYDMVTGSEIRLDQGVLPTAMRASMSIPGAFATVPIDTLVLVDGGVVNNFPVDVVREMGAEIVIGSDVTAGMKNEPDQLRDVMKLINQFTAIIGHASYVKNRDDTDLYIHPDIEPYSAGSFSAEAIDTLLRRGEECARAQWDEIEALRERIGIAPDLHWRRPTVQRYRVPPWIEVRRIHIEGLSPVDERIIRRNLSLREHSGTTIANIQKEINILRGTNLYSNVTYQLSGESPFDLTIYLVEASRNSLNLGVRFDTEVMAAILLNATLGPRGIRGAGVELTSRLSKNPYLRVDFSIGNTFLGQGRISYLFSYNDVDLYRNARKENSATFARHLLDLGFSRTGLRNSRMTIGAQYDFYDFHDFLFSDPTSRELPVRRQGIISYYFDARWETVDNRYFPTRGISFNGRYQLSTDNFVGYGDGPPFHALSLQFHTALSVSDRVAFFPTVYGRALIGPNVAFPYWNCVGGSVAGRYLPQQLPFIGLRHVEAAEDVLMIGRLDFRVRLWRRHYASLIGNYAWESESINRIDRGRYMVGGGLNYAYDSPIGPIALLLDYSSRGHKIGAYFSLGRYF